MSCLDEVMRMHLELGSYTTFFLALGLVLSIICLIVLARILSARNRRKREGQLTFVEQVKLGRYVGKNDSGNIPYVRKKCPRCGSYNLKAAYGKRLVCKDCGKIFT